MLPLPDVAAVRFSTVGGESGSADEARDPRGFAMKYVVAICDRVSQRPASGSELARASGISS